MTTTRPQAHQLPTLQQLHEWRDADVTRDAVLLCVRIGLAWIFIYHGAGTLFNAFTGPGLHGQAVFFSMYAHLHPGTFWAVVNGCTEFFGGIAVGLGVFARLAALGLFFDMVIAMITVTFKNGVVSNAVGSGYELNIALAVAALVVAVLGAGRFALGRFLRDAAARARR